MNVLIRGVEDDQLATYRAWAALVPNRSEQRNRLIAFMADQVEAGALGAEEAQRVEVSRIAQALELVAQLVAALPDGHTPRDMAAEIVDEAQQAKSDPRAFLAKLDAFVPGKDER